MSQHRSDSPRLCTSVSLVALQSSRSVAELWGEEKSFRLSLLARDHCGKQAQIK